MIIQSPPTIIIQAQKQATEGSILLNIRRRKFKYKQQHIKCCTEISDEQVSQGNSKSGNFDTFGKKTVSMQLKAIKKRRNINISEDMSGKGLREAKIIPYEQKRQFMCRSTHRIGIIRKNLMPAGQDIVSETSEKRYEEGQRMRQEKRQEVSSPMDQQTGQQTDQKAGSNRELQTDQEMKEKKRGVQTGQAMSLEEVHYILVQEQQRLKQMDFQGE